MLLAAQVQNINGSLSSKPMRTQIRIPAPTLIPKRRINIIPDNNVLTVFNRHSELKVFRLETVEIIRNNNMTSGYAPGIQIKDAYIREIPEHLQECTQHINLEFWKWNQDISGPFIIQLRESLLHITLNKCYIQEQLLESYQWLGINKIMGSWPITFIKFFEKNINLLPDILECNLEGKFNSFIYLANHSNIQNYQIFGKYLVTLKGINIEDVIFLVQDSMMHIQKLETLNLLFYNSSNGLTLDVLNYALEVLSFI